MSAARARAHLCPNLRCPDQRQDELGTRVIAVLENDAQRSAWWRPRCPAYGARPPAQWPSAFLSAHGSRAPWQGTPAAHADSAACQICTTSGFSCSSITSKSVYAGSRSAPRSPGTLGLHIAHRREHGVRVPGDRYGMHGEYLSAACDYRFQFPYFHHFVPFWASGRPKASYCLETA